MLASSIEVSEDFLQECESRIRLGDFQYVLASITGISGKLVQRKFRLPLANIARRVGKTWLAAKFLSPVFQPEVLREQQPSDEEKLEYSLLLSRLGSFAEAEEILGSVDQKNSLTFFQYKAYLAMFCWNYQESTPLLQKYLHRDPDTYNSYVVRLNLVSGLVFLERWSECLPILDDIEVFARRAGHNRILANAYELRAQILFHQNKLDLAQDEISTAENILVRTGTADRMLIDKWKAIIMAFKLRDKTIIQKFRKTAELSQHWESVRDCDYFGLQLKFDRQEFDHLYFGTPYESYRQRLKLKFDHAPSNSTYLLWRETKPGPFLPHSKIIDLRTGAVLNGQGTIQSPPFEGKDLALLGSLSLDFYRSVPLGTLFMRLYPGSYFDPYSSPARLKAVVNRLRRRLEDNEIPMQIRLENLQYRIKLEESCGILMSAECETFDRNTVLLRRLKNRFSNQHVFSALDIEETLHISRTASLRLIKWGIEKSQLAITGQGRATRYTFLAA